MKKIKIANSKLVLRFYEPVNGKINLLDKEQMRYQSVYYEGGLEAIDSGGTRTILSKGNVKHWVLETDKCQNGPMIFYTQDELNFILQTIIQTPYRRLNVIEDLALAVGLGLEFYESPDIEDFKVTIKSLLSKPIIKQKQTTKQQKRYGDSRRYSVYRLLNDLEKDKAFILMDPDLVGKYDRISASMVKQDKIIDLEEWMQVKQVEGNLRRANLSLSCDGIVRVEVPKNTKGVKEGIRELKRNSTFTIVRDGILNHRYLAVSVSSQLSRKLKCAKLVDGELIWKNSYLIDLQKLPIICRHEIKKPSITTVAKLLAKRYKIQEAIRILQQCTSPKTEILGTEEIYLRSLGIYGNNYIEQRTRRRGTKPYSYKELDFRVSRSNGNDSVVRNELYRIKQGLPELNKGIRAYIISIISSGKTVEDFKKEEAEVTKRLRDINFRALCSKVFIAPNPYFCDDCEINWKISKRNVSI